MSIKFAIRNTASKANKEGDAFIRYSGTGEPFSRNCERTSIATEMDAQGTPTKWVFTTGLDEKQVEFYKWFNEWLSYGFAH